LDIAVIWEKIKDTFYIKGEVEIDIGTCYVIWFAIPLRHGNFIENRIILINFQFSHSTLNGNGIAKSF
jgi:hypothetical protein